MWNAISLVQDLNTCRRVHFLHRILWDDPRIVPTIILRINSRFSSRLEIFHVSKRNKSLSQFESCSVHNKSFPKISLTDTAFSWTLEKSAANLQPLVCILNTALLSSLTLKVRPMSLSTRKAMEQTQSGNFTNNFNFCRRFLVDPKKVFITNSRVCSLLALQFRTSSKESAK